MVLGEWTAKHRGPGLGLPKAVYWRQTWRPPALRGARSLLSRISRRNEPFDRQWARVTWQAQLALRGRPFMAWLPLALQEFGAHSQPQFKTMSSMTFGPVANVAPAGTNRVLQNERHGTQSHGPVAGQRFETSSVWRSSISRPVHAAYASKDAQPGHASLDSPQITIKPTAEGPPPPEVRKRATTDATVPKPPVELPFVRPLIRLAALRPTSGAPGEFSPTPSRTNDSVEPEILRATNPQVFRPRLVSSVSPSPRQELPGGFPAHQEQEIDPGLGILAESAFNSVCKPSAQNSVSPHSHSHAGQHTPNISETARIIQSLIPRTSEPAALPGIQMRMVSPDTALSMRRVSAPEEKHPAVEGTPRHAPAPAPPPALPAATPALDINSVADKVYQTLMRRHQFERERRGLY